MAIYSLTDWLLTGAIFLFFFFLFQWIARRHWKNRELWICADYIWLAFAVLGVFGALRDWRRSEASIRAEDEQQLCVYRAYDRAANISHAISPVALKEGGHQDNEHAISEWGRWAFNALGTSPMVIDAFIKKSEALLHDGTIPADVFRAVIEEMQEQRDDFRRIAQMKESMAVSTTERIFMAFTPVFLSIALSLRLGKVTADLMRTRNGKKEALG